MLDIGLWELACLATVSFIVFGPEKSMLYSKKAAKHFTSLKQLLQSTTSDHHDSPRQ